MKKALIISALVWFCTTIALAECIFYKPVQIKEIKIGNLISWSTLSEVGNEKFVIEKSIDGVTFTDIGEVDGSGDSEEVQKYAFLDIKTGVSEAYYRLRMLDDQSFESLTHTIFYTREAHNDYVFTSMSSPTTAKHFTIVMESMAQGMLEYKVVNQKKEVLIDKSRKISEGRNMISVNLEEFPLGTYKLITSLNKEVEEVTIKKVNPENHPDIQYVIK